MYYVYADETSIYNPLDKSLTIHSPKISLELGKAGSFQFDMPPSNQYYNKLTQLKTIIRVEIDNTTVFYGRVFSITRSFNNMKKVYCEGILSYLIDTVQKGKSYKGKARALFNEIIAAHNSMVGSDKRFQIGTVNIEDVDVVIPGKSDNEGNYYGDAYEQAIIDSIADEWLTSYEYIQNILIDYLGGFLIASYQNGRNRIDYISEQSYENNLQEAERKNSSVPEIDYGVNMLDLEEEMNAEELFTVIVPIGDGNLTIENATNRNSHDDVRIETVDGKQIGIADKKAVDAYGKIVKSHVFSDVNDANTLFENGYKYLKSHKNIPISFTVKAVDMHFVDKDTQIMSLGDVAKINSAPHNLIQYLICTKIEYDLNDPSKNTYTFGNPKESLTERYKKNRNKEKERSNDSSKDSGTKALSTAAGIAKAYTDDALKKVNENYATTRHWVEDHYAGIENAVHFVSTNGEGLVTSKMWVDEYSANAEEVLNWHGKYSKSLVNTTKWANDNSAGVREAIKWYNSKALGVVETKKWVDAYGANIREAAIWNSKYAFSSVYTTKWANDNSAGVREAIKWYNSKALGVVETKKWVDAYGTNIREAAIWNSKYAVSSVETTKWAKDNSAGVREAISWYNKHAYSVIETKKWVDAYGANIREAAVWNSKYAFSSVYTTKWANDNSAGVREAINWYNKNAYSVIETKKWVDAYGANIKEAAVWNSKYAVSSVETTKWASDYSAGVREAIKWYGEYAKVTISTNKWVSKNKAKVQEVVSWYNSYAISTVDTVKWASKNSAGIKQTIKWYNQYACSTVETNKWVNKNKATFKEMAKWKDETVDSLAEISATASKAYSAAQLIAKFNGNEASINLKADAKKAIIKIVGDEIDASGSTLLAKILKADHIYTGLGTNTSHVSISDKGFYTSGEASVIVGSKGKVSAPLIMSNKYIKGSTKDDAGPDYQLLSKSEIVTLIKNTITSSYIIDKIDGQNIAAQSVSINVNGSQINLINYANSRISNHYHRGTNSYNGGINM